MSSINREKKPLPLEVTYSSLLNTESSSFESSFLNVTKLDPPKWGWCANGGIVDVLSPHLRARRKYCRNDNSSSSITNNDNSGIDKKREESGTSSKTRTIEEEKTVEEKK